MPGGPAVLGLIFAVCRWPLSAPNPLWCILWPIIDPILVTFGRISGFRDPT